MEARFHRPGDSVWFNINVVAFQPLPPGRLHRSRWPKTGLPTSRPWLTSGAFFTHPGQRPSVFQCSSSAVGRTRM